MSITKVSCVYHADGGLVGELRYIVGKLRGTVRCDLCDITHGLTGKKAEFARCEASLGIPIELLHLNERSAALRAFTEGKTPCVVGHGAAGLSMLLDAQTLAQMAGSVRQFEDALRAALARVSG